jgi:hypothetical protein
VDKDCPNAALIAQYVALFALAGLSQNYLAAVKEHHRLVMSVEGNTPNLYHVAAAYKIFKGLNKQSDGYGKFDELLASPVDTDISCAWIINAASASGLAKDLKPTEFRRSDIERVTKRLCGGLLPWQTKWKMAMAIPAGEELTGLLNRAAGALEQVGSLDDAANIRRLLTARCLTVKGR